MTKPSTPANLRAFVGTDHDEASLLAALLADPGTARLLAAWRRSIVDLEAARAAAAGAGDDEVVRQLDGVEIPVCAADPTAGGK